MREQGCGLRRLPEKRVPMSSFEGWVRISQLKVNGYYVLGRDRYLFIGTDMRRCKEYWGVA